VSGFLAAARYLTIVPLPGPRAAEPIGRAVAWFPAVGVLLGVMLAALDRVAVAVAPSLPAAVLTVAAWKVLTGGLHLDGLADCLDGLAGRDPAHRLAIMRDSRLGTFGGAGLSLALVLAIAALAETPAALRRATLVAAPAIGRAAPPLLGVLFPPARVEGHGAAFIAGLGRGGVALGLGFALAAAVALLGWPGALAFGLAMLAVVALGRFMAGRLGGITGDVLGAAVEVAELIALLTVAAAARPR
jgi:adenosylcobinamide-GDP ribazoletransferase